MVNTEHFQSFFIRRFNCLQTFELTQRTRSAHYAKEEFNAHKDVIATLLGLLKLLHKIGVHPLINFSLSKWHFINSSNICHICKICLGTHLIKRRDNIWSLALHSWGIKDCIHSYREKLSNTTCICKSKLHTPYQTVNTSPCCTLGVVQWPRRFSHDLNENSQSKDFN